MRGLIRTVGALLGVAILASGGTALADDDDGKPGVLSESAKDISASGALLRAYVNQRGRSTTYVFQYGTGSAYGSETASADAGSADGWKLVTATVAQLEPSTSYHYRVVATNSRGTTYGSDRTFTTLAAGDPGGSSGGGAGDQTTGEPGEMPGPGSDLDRPSAESELDVSVAVERSRGVVRVRKPGSSSFVELDGDAELPAGSEIDARKGAITLTSALPSGKTQSGEFGGGRFVIRPGRRGYVNLHLRGAICPRRDAGMRSDTAAIAARRPRPGRRLWGRDKGGRFRTHGKNSHATVRGTRWMVADRCDGTLTRVSEGSVLVRDTVRGKRKLLKAGEHYLAPSRR